ncbi:outer membrane protein assembly factor BamA [Candidatus Purcelliella pentastirinorum]|nr:outer membrane protein assembly factor BamA [Candidatus Purcelliella pentastirinorum]WDI79012.1 outer membrane protein assembly factor BamA [Candidatus Purcelliella pentastirinorum]WDR80149.1 outer membrane protein assembly factor BamA [Candidatus Purcelliella pentastirinorum]
MNTFLIKNIYVHGLRNLTFHNIISETFFIKKKKFSNEDISNFIKLLYHTGNFDEIKIFRDKYDLIIKVKEKPIISNICIIGNKFIDYKLLKDSMYLHKIIIGKPLDCFSLLTFEKTLNDFYNKIGRYKTKIKFFITPLDNNKIDLKLMIIESDLINIKRVNILGNNNFSLKYLTYICGIKKYFLGFDLFYKNNYRKENFMIALQKLHDFYLNHGYICFKINSTQLNLSRNKKNIYITINIHEGKKYKISNIFINNDFENPYNLNNLISIKINEVYNFSKIMSIIVNIKKLLSRFGYINPFIDIKTKINHKNNTVKLYFNIDNGKRFYVEKISFSGNFVSRDSMLRSEIKQMENSLFNIDLINVGISNLKRTGYFKDINVCIKNLSSSTNRVNIVYKIQELNTGLFNIGAGYSHDGGVSFKFSLNKNNWLGVGDNISLSIVKNNLQNYGKLEFTSLHFIIDRINLSSNIIYNNSIPEENLNFSNYVKKSYLFNNILNFNLNNQNSFGLGLGYTYDNLLNIKPQVVVWRYLKSMGKKFNYLHKENLVSNDFIFNYNFIFDSLNKQVYPVFGSYNKLDTKITIPGSKNNYFQIVFDSYKYLPMDKYFEWILSNHIFLGYGHGIGKKEIPFYQNFYAGGIDTIRGFVFNDVGPKAVYYNPLLKNNNLNEYSFCRSNDIIGGNSIIITNTELILPNFFINNNYTKNIRYSLFLDSGIVLDTNWNNTNNFNLLGIPDYSNLYNIRVSSGISFKWISPIGPLTFSYAIPIKTSLMDKLEKFQFSMGKIW